MIPLKSEVHPGADWQGEPVMEACLKKVMACKLPRLQAGTVKNYVHSLSRGLAEKS